MNTPEKTSPDTDQIVVKILAGMSLKEKVLIAQMDERSLPYLQYAFDIYISSEIGEDPETGREITRLIWRQLQETHRIRVVK